MSDAKLPGQGLAEKTALILVDLQNDFLPGGSLAVPAGDEVLPIAARLMDPPVGQKGRRFDLVVATQDFHPADHRSFAAQHPGKKIGEVIDLDGLPQVLWPAHCVAGSRGAELAAALDGRRVDAVVKKGTDRAIDSYSAFFDNGHRKSTGLSDLLEKHAITDVYVLGLATDYCVKLTTLDAIGLGYRTTLIEDACRGVELSPGDCARAIAEMRRAGARVVRSDAL